MEAGGDRTVGMVSEAATEFGLAGFDKSSAFYSPWRVRGKEGGNGATTSCGINFPLHCIIEATTKFYHEGKSFHYHCFFVEPYACLWLDHVALHIRVVRIRAPQARLPGTPSSNVLRLPIFSRLDKMVVV